MLVSAEKTWHLRNNKYSKLDLCNVVLDPTAALKHNIKLKAFFSVKPIKERFVSKSKSLWYHFISNGFRMAQR